MTFLNRNYESQVPPLRFAQDDREVVGMAHATISLLYHSIGRLTFNRNSPNKVVERRCWGEYNRVKWLKFSKEK